MARAEKLLPTSCEALLAGVVPVARAEVAVTEPLTEETLEPEAEAEPEALEAAEEAAEDAAEEADEPAAEADETAELAPVAVGATLA
jgi:hypothetical protein